MPTHSQLQPGTAGNSRPRLTEGYAGRSRRATTERDFRQQHRLRCWSFVYQLFPRCYPARAGRLQIKHPCHAEAMEVSTTDLQKPPAPKGGRTANGKGIRPLHTRTQKEKHARDPRRLLPAPRRPGRAGRARRGEARRLGGPQLPAGTLECSVAAGVCRRRGEQGAAPASF